ncbi:putative nuclease HARBI1 [Coccinella septempunctata]|uniref:putative nuclease HARBI1 n=1 Tax=Coccinella septempunctata TaxID=41139 RepID=UPI001D08179E|nr:putative nuclease HARBI1 [Coccinella septempunctata]
MSKRKIAAIVSLAFDSFFDDDDEVEEEITCVMLSSRMIEKPVAKRRRICIQNYEEVVLHYSPSEFQGHFRLERRTVQDILEKIGEKVYRATSLGGRPSCPQKQLLLTIWMLANQEVYRSVADRFNVSLSTAWEYFQRVVNVLLEVSSIYIKWPESYENITRKFKKRGGIDGVIGAIDGTHISITTPSYMSNKYLNRKQYHSIVLQGVCDASYIFTDCFAGCPGSMHDARVYRMSPLFTQIMPNITGDYHLLGDSPYPNATNLITPYRDNGHLTRQQRHFNYLHSATRVHNEESFEFQNLLIFIKLKQFQIL